MVMWRWVLLKHFPFGTPTHTLADIPQLCVYLWHSRGSRVRDDGRPYRRKSLLAHNH